MTLLAAADLLFASRIQEAARGTGVEVTVAPRDSDLLARARELCPAALALDLSGVLDSPALIVGPARRAVPSRASGSSATRATSRSNSWTPPGKLARTQCSRGANSPASCPSC